MTDEFFKIVGGTILTCGISLIVFFWCFMTWLNHKLGNIGNSKKHED